MFELYQTKKGSRGSLAEVWIDKDAGLVKKHYKPNGITIRGTRPLYDTMDAISSLFWNEIKWSAELKSRFVLEIYEHGELVDGPGYYVVQEYVGPDLLRYYDGKQLSNDIPNPKEQLVDMFRYFSEKNVYKINNAMCNMVNDRGVIKAFDFKYATSRTAESRPYEIYSIDTWLSKIDNTLPTVLLDYV